MACDLSFLVLKAVAAFQDPQHVARSQFVCKNWCWGTREQIASITSSSICKGSSSIGEALLSGACAPELLVLDIVGRHEVEVEVMDKEKKFLEVFLAGLKQYVWFKKLALVQERVNAGSCSAVYTRKAGYSANWQLELAAPLVETSLMVLPPRLQVLDLRLECLPGLTALSAVGSCSSLKSLALDCQQGTLTIADAEQLQGQLGPTLQALYITLPELQLPAVEALMSSLTSLTSLRLDRKTASVSALAVRGLTGLKKLQEIRLSGYGVVTMSVLKGLMGLTALELSHAGMEAQDDWQALGTLTALRELHLVPTATAMMVQRQVNCEVPVSLPQLTSLKMLIHDHPAALHLLNRTPLLHTLHLTLPHTKDLSSSTLEPLASLATLCSLTLTGTHLTMNTSMLCTICSVAHRVTQLMFLGRVGPLEGLGLAPLASALTKLKHLALGARHMDQMFVVDVEKELPGSLETLELCSACIVQQSPKAGLARVGVAHEAGRQVGIPVGVLQEEGIGLRENLRVSKAGSKQQDPKQGSKEDEWTPAVGTIAHIAPAQSSAETGATVRWPHLHTLRLHKCCGLPYGSTNPNSSMLHPIVLDLHSAPHLASLVLTDCTVSDNGLDSMLTSSTLSSLTLAPYENWRSTAAQLTATGMQEVLWSNACMSLQQLELRLTHRMHRDGTDAALVGTVLPGMGQLRALRLFTEESHWHRLPAVKSLGRLRKLQQLRLGAVHERRVQGVVAGLQQVLPQHCRLSVVKYSPELLEE